MGQKVQGYSVTGRCSIVALELISDRGLQVRRSDFREPGERFVAEVSLSAELAENAGSSQRYAVNQYIFGRKIELEANFRSRIAWVANSDALFT